MNMKLKIGRRSPKPDKVYRVLMREVCKAGRGAGEEYLPGENELTRRFGVSRKTVRTALERLAAEGYLRAQKGIGWRVLDRPADVGLGKMLFLTPFSNPSLFPGFVPTVKGKGMEAGFSVVVHDTTSLSLEELDALLADAVGVLYLSGYGIPEEVYNKCAGMNLPMVCAGAHASLPYDTVSSDNAMMASLLARKVTLLGYRKVVVLGNTLLDHSFAIRHEVFVSEAEKLGLETRSVRTPDLYFREHDLDPLFDAIEAWGAELVVCVSEKAAEFLLPYLLMRGKRVPRDISLVALGDPVLNSVLQPYGLENIAFATHPWEEIACFAVDRLRARIAGQLSVPRLTLVTPDIHEIDSMPSIKDKHNVKQVS